jgi:chromosome segregation ATPase
LFTTKLSELSSKIKEFEKETTRLVNTDFTELFNGLQKVFIDQTRRDLATELMRFEEKSKDLQTKIDELKRQIERLEQIDIEKHFDKFQKNISEIFGAINSINVTLTSTTQNLNSIVQSLGAIQTAIDTSQKEIKQVINSLREATLTHLTDQDLELKKNSELLESKIKLLMAQNQMLKKEIGGNRIIQFLGFGIIIIVLVYLILTIHS